MDTMTRRAALLSAAPLALLAGSALADTTASEARSLLRQWRSAKARLDRQYAHTSAIDAAGATLTEVRASEGAADGLLDAVDSIEARIFGLAERAGVTMPANDEEALAVVIDGWVFVSASQSRCTWAMSPDRVLVIGRADPASR